MKTIKKKNQKNKIKEDKLRNTVHKVIDNIYDLIKKIKNKYDKTDEKTKDRITKGVTGSVALIAGIIGFKRVKNKKKEKNS